MEWISVKDRLPENAQNCLFVTTTDRKVYSGFYLAPKKTKEESKDYNGSFTVGFIYDNARFSIRNDKTDFGCVWGIGFNVWKSNEYEVTHWMPLPEFAQ
jgi:hypothetical protein